MMDLKVQFKTLAKIMLEVENTTLRMCSVGLPGIPLTTLDLILKSNQVSAKGEETLLAMILQSDKVQISECQTMLVPKTQFIGEQIEEL
jgi:hypothetical protein